MDTLAESAHTYAESLSVPHQDQDSSQQQSTKPATIDIGLREPFTGRRGAAVDHIPTTGNRWLEGGIADSAPARLPGCWQEK